MADPKSKIYQFAGAELTVDWDLKRCIHARKCVQGLPAVFDAEKRPWVEPDRASAAEVRTVIEQCPSGALQYKPSGDGPEETIPASNSVTPAANGPLVATGDLALELASGAAVRDTRMTLCRCGGSENKPYCDGSHAKIGFTDNGQLGESKLGETEGDSVDLSISPAPDGPLIVSGPLTITGTDSAEQTGSRGALCRCGASQNKPYCDGAHKAIGFEAT